MIKVGKKLEQKNNFELLLTYLWSVQLSLVAFVVLWKRM